MADVADGLVMSTQTQKCSTSAGGNARPIGSPPASILRKSKSALLADLAKENAATRVQFADDDDNGDEKAKANKPVANALANEESARLPAIDAEEAVGVSDHQEMNLFRLNNGSCSTKEKQKVKSPHQGLTSRPSIILTIGDDSDDEVTVLHEPEWTQSFASGINMPPPPKPIDPSTEAKWRQVARECAIFGAICGIFVFWIPAVWLAFRKGTAHSPDQRVLGYKRSFALSLTGVILFVIAVTLGVMALK